MKKVVLLVVMLITQIVCACESPLDYPREIRSADGYNPFREGLIVDKIFEKPRRFFTYYQEIKPEILQFLGPEISNFYEKYPESTIASVIHRYLYAVTVRLLLKREGSRKIEIVHQSIPAHYKELTQILHSAVTIEYTTDRDTLHKELENYLEVVRTHARNQEKNRNTRLNGNTHSERTAHEKDSHYSPS